MFEANFKRVHFSEHEMAWNVHDNYIAQHIGRVELHEREFRFIPVGGIPIHADVLARVARFIEQESLELDPLKYLQGLKRNNT